jgi:hypothetical protein
MDDAEEKMSEPSDCMLYLSFLACAVSSMVLMW